MSNEADKVTINCVVFFLQGRERRRKFSAKKKQLSLYGEQEREAQ